MLKSERTYVALASAICMATGMSAIFMGSFPVFLEPVSQAMGWGKSVFPQAVMIVAFTGALCNPFSGRLIDRIGVKIPVLVGLVLFGLGLIGLATIRNAGPMFWLSALAIGISASLAGPLAFVKIISSWFDDNRALVLGLILATAPMLSQAGIAPMARTLIETLGWRSAYVVIAAAVVIIGGLSAALFLKLKPQMTVSHSDSPALSAMPGVTAVEAYKSPTFWCLTAAGALATGALMGTQSHLVTWLTGRGTSGATAALLLSVLALAGIAGTALSGYLVDRFRTQRITIVFYSVPLLGLICLNASTSPWALIPGAIMLGLGLSAVTGLSPYLITRYFGLKASGEIFGVSLAVCMVSIGLGPFLIGVGYDAGGSYTMPMLVAIGTLAVATLLMAQLKPYVFGLPAKPELVTSPIPPETAKPETKLAS